MSPFCAFEQFFVIFTHRFRRAFFDKRNVFQNQITAGKYVCFVDDDDWVSATYLEGLLSVAKGDEAMVIGNVMNFDEGKNVFVDDWLTASYRRNSQLPEKASLMSCRSFMSVACCKLTARKAIGDYRFDTSFKQGEDSLFNATMSHRLRDFGVAPPDVIYYRRLRQSSASRTRSYADVFKDNFRLAVAFAKIYCKGMDKYDFLFFDAQFSLMRKLFGRFALINSHPIEFCFKCFACVGIG